MSFGQWGWHKRQEWDITPTIHHVLVAVQSPSQCPILSICPWGCSSIAPQHRGQVLAPFHSSGKEIRRKTLGQVHPITTPLGKLRLSKLQGSW